MNQIDTIQPSLVSLHAVPSRLEPARRLFVLVPDLEADYMPAIRRIWELANVQQAHVLLFGLCNNARQEPGLRRRLISMCAMMQDDLVLVEAMVEVGTDWVSVIDRNYQTGDTVVCFAEQSTGLLHRPLSQILQSNLKIPVYILSNLRLPKPKSNLLLQVKAWLGFLGIIAGFFVLQMDIVQVFKGGFQTILLCLSIVPEFWLLLFWNNLYG